MKTRPLRFNPFLPLLRFLLAFILLHPSTICLADECPTCQGSGRVTCPRCGGSGGIDPVNCGGASGLHGCPDCGGTYGNPCVGGSTQGSGYVQCPSCGGSGEVSSSAASNRASEEQAAAAARKEALAEQRKREQEEARRKQEEFERSKQEALKSMKGVSGEEPGLKGTDSNDDLGLKGVGDSGDLGLKGGREQKDLGLKEPGNALAQTPTKKRMPFDCEKARATRERLAAGLPVQKEAIRRTELQIAAAASDVQKAQAEFNKAALAALVAEILDYAKNVATSAKVLRENIELLNELQVKKSVRDGLLRSLLWIIKSAESVHKSFKEGYKAGTALSGDMKQLTDKLWEINKMLVDSGIAGMLGEKLSESLAGPLGKYAFKGAQLSIDLVVAFSQKKLSQAELQQAKTSLDIMRSQYRRIEKMIAKIDLDIQQQCQNKS